MVIHLNVPGFPGLTSTMAGCSSASRHPAAEGCYHLVVSQKRSSGDDPSAAPGLARKVSPVPTPPLQPAPRFWGVTWALQPCFSQIFMSALWVGVTDPCSLVRGREGAACPQQSQRLVPSPALQTAPKYDQGVFSSLCFFFSFSLSFCFNIRCLKRSM